MKLPLACGTALENSTDSSAYPGVFALAMLLLVTSIAVCSACRDEVVIPNKSDTMILRATPRFEIYPLRKDIGGSADF